MNTPFERNDYMAWNRRGLPRFRYLNANAKTVLEELRTSFAQDFSQWQDVQIPDAENSQQRSLRIDNQYSGSRRDFAWEIARAFSRAEHVLLGHIDAFANEGFIGTATQWEYLRRLVELVDYRPRPPSSASLPIALITPETVDPGVVKRGLQSKYTDTDNGKALTFESLEDLHVDPILNGFRVSGWNVNPGTFNPSQHLWDKTEKDKLNAGELAILIDQTKQSITTISNVSVDKFQISAGLSGTDFHIGTSQLLTNPTHIFTPSPNGLFAYETSNPNNFSVGQIIYWGNDFAKVEKVDRFGVQLGFSGSKPLIDHSIEISDASRLSAKQYELHNQWILTTNVSESIFASTVRSDGSPSGLSNIAITAEYRRADDELATGRVFVDPTAYSGTLDLVYYDPATSQVLANFRPVSLNSTLKIEGSPGKLKTGDYMIAVDSNNQNHIVQVQTLIKEDGWFQLGLVSKPSGINITKIIGPFETVYRHPKYDLNEEPISFNQMKLEFDTLPENIVPGKKLLFETEIEGEDNQAVLGIIQEIDHGHLTIALQGIVPVGSIKGNLLIRGNVVIFGHGETLPTNILGSGNAGLINQSFLLEEDEVTFVHDTRLEAGVRADISIRVNDRLYKEVSTLADSEAHDPHYEIRMTETGSVNIIFGDGFKGRRLPTGQDNLVIDYRVGSGSSGNLLPANVLQKPAKPDPRVKRFSQPIAASGGQDIEGPENIRVNAPKHLKALGRAVSHSDFESIVESTPGIWKAKSAPMESGSPIGDRYKIIVVPAEGAPLGTFGNSLSKRLKTLSPPGYKFVIERFDPVILQLSIKLRIKLQEFDADKVEKAVINAVFEAFSLKNRSPAEPVYLSQIYQIVENINGVETSEIDLFPGLMSTPTSQSGVEILNAGRHSSGEIWTLTPQINQLIYLESPSTIGVLVSETER